MENTNDDRKVASQENTNTPPPGDETLDTSPQYCEEINDNAISSVACMPAQSSESPPEKKRKHTKRCRICKTTEGIIVSNACHLHLN